VQAQKKLTPLPSPSNFSKKIITTHTYLAGIKKTVVETQRYYVILSRGGGSEKKNIFGEHSIAQAF
jgi:hypothetical protein